MNLVDWCALAIPNGYDAGLPTSLQVACRGGHEELALRIGFALEAAGGHGAGRPDWLA